VIQASAVDARKWCAQRCLDSADCVAFNYPDPGNGYCWIKRGDDWKKSTVLNKNCGWSSSFDYYTLVSRTAQSPESLLQPPSTPFKLAMNINPSDGHNFGWGTWPTNVASGTFVGAEESKLTKDFVDGTV
jgi:hypothetical protein